MRRTEVLQGIRLMRFEEILERTRSRELSQEEAASALGMSERTFRRYRDRFEADGAEGLYDRRLGRGAVPGGPQQRAQPHRDTGLPSGQRSQRIQFRVGVQPEGLHDQAVEVLNQVVGQEEGAQLLGVQLGEGRRAGEEFVAVVAR